MGRKVNDFTGQKHGKATFTHMLEREPGSPVKWAGVCECGQHVIFAATYIRVFGATLKCRECVKAKFRELAKNRASSPRAKEDILAALAQGQSINMVAMRFGISRDEARSIAEGNNVSA